MLLFLDSADHYAAADVAEKYATGTTTIATGAGALASHGHRGIDVVQAVDPGDATIVVGAWIRVGSDGPDECLDIRIGDGGVGGGLTQVAIVVTSVGAIELYRGDEVALLASSPAFTLNSDLSYTIGIRVTIGNAGSVEVVVDGETVLEATGIDTQATGAAQYSHVAIASSAGAGGTVVDSIYLADGDGGLEEPLGLAHVEALRPLDAAGTYAEWDTSDDLVDPGTLINDVPNDPDTYLETSDVGARATFGLEPATVAGTIAGVQVTLTAVRTNTAAARSITAIVVIGGVVYAHPTPQAVGDTRTGYRFVWTTNPATSDAWTIAALAAAEFGVRLEA